MAINIQVLSDRQVDPSTIYLPSTILSEISKILYKYINKV